jgi:hypothetical protein
MAREPNPLSLCDDIVDGARRTAPAGHMLSANAINVTVLEIRFSDAIDRPLYIRPRRQQVWAVCPRLLQIAV